jgi:Predicted ATPase
MARLDRLGAVAREVAQIGAAIGREFSYEVLAPIAQKTDMEVQTALSRLTDAELVFCRGTPPQATFLFKHALVRDVAYGSLLRGQRQQLHGRIADVLAEHFPTTVEAEPEVLAHHYREAGMADAAAHTSSALATALPLAPPTSRRRRISGQRSRKRIAYLRRMSAPAAL